LAAYDDRGRRLRDALVADRAEDRWSRDARIRTLLQDNQRLEGDLKRLRDSQMPSSSPAAANSPTVSARAVAAEKELSDMALKLKAAEALARHRERELEQLRSRLDQAVADAARRQEREREALAKPLRRRAATRDDPLLAVAVAHQARAENLQNELTALTKHGHTLSFQLEASQEKCRTLEAQQQFSRPSKNKSSENRLTLGSSSADVEQLRVSLAREAELRGRSEEELRSQAAAHGKELQGLSHRLQELAAQNAQLVAERREAARQPSAGELRWQREALRLRDELAEARKAWRAADPRALMRRDKEIRSLGLVPRVLEDTVKKADLVAILLDVCRLLKVGDLTQVVPRATAAAELLNFGEGVADVLRELGEAASPDRRGEDELSSLQRLALELRTLRAESAARQEAAATQAAATPELAKDALGVSLAAELSLPDNAGTRECLQRVADLRAAEAVLRGLAEQLRCPEPKETPKRLQSLLQLFDERLAAQKIVEALQKLLRAGSIDEVLPALREVLDVSALRRRAMHHEGGRGA
jgi:hypothetical protein